MQFGEDLGLDPKAAPTDLPGCRITCREGGEGEERLISSPQVSPPPERERVCVCARVCERERARERERKRERGHIIHSHIFTVPQ